MRVLGHSEKQEESGAEAVHTRLWSTRRGCVLHGSTIVGDAPQSVARPSRRRPLVVSAPPNANRKALVAPSLPGRLRRWKGTHSCLHTRRRLLLRRHIPIIPLQVVQQLVIPPPPASASTTGHCTPPGGARSVRW